jgi:hypothetical protein
MANIGYHVNSKHMNAGLVDKEQLQKFTQVNVKNTILKEALARFAVNNTELKEKLAKVEKEKPTG